MNARNLTLFASIGLLYVLVGILSYRLYDPGNRLTKADVTTAVNSAIQPLKKETDRIGNLESRVSTNESSLGEITKGTGNAFSNMSTTPGFKAAVEDAASATASPQWAVLRLENFDATPQSISINGVAFGINGKLAGVGFGFTPNNNPRQITVPMNSVIKDDRGTKTFSVDTRFVQMLIKPTSNFTTELVKDFPR